MFLLRLEDEENFSTFIRNSILKKKIYNSRLWKNPLIKLSQTNLANEKEVIILFCINVSSNFNTLEYLLITITVYVVEISRLLSLFSLSNKWIYLHLNVYLFTICNSFPGGCGGSYHSQKLIYWTF